MDMLDNNVMIVKQYVFAFSNTSAEKLKKDVDKAYNLLEISDANGHDMIYDRIDTNKILKWWEMN